MKRFYDTSALLNKADDLVIDKDDYISSIVLSELEHIKSSYSKDQHIKEQARKVIRILQSGEFSCELGYKKEIEQELKKNANYLQDNADSRILLEALIFTRKKKEKIVFLTGDLTLYLLACHFGLTCALINETSQKRFYDGFRYITPTEEEWTKLYDMTNEENIFGLLVNEYAILKNENSEIKSIVRWDGEDYVQLGYRDVMTTLFGKISPRNLEQKCYFDLLQNPKIPVVNCIGRVGGGKTFAAIANALYLIEQGQYDKLIYVRNNFGVENTKDPGALPGDLDAKLRPFLGPLIDIVGSEEYVDQLIEERKVEQVHLGYLRGRSLKNCFVLVDESQNLTPSHVKMLLSRMAENSKLVFCGDYSQCDSKIFRNEGNGIMRMNERLQDNKLYGQIRLNKIERSEVCQLADKMD